MCEKREKRLDRSLPRSPRTRSASPPDARASPHAATWPVSGINSQLLTVGARMDSLDWPAVGRISHFQVAHSATGGEGGTGGPRGHPGLSYCQTPAFLKSPAFT